MKACGGLWITAAIQRAVDDKTAKKLLGDSFKRQLKFDGQYSAVTFICTKTDDILESEVSRSLGLDGEVAETRERIDSLDKQCTKLKSQLEDLKEQKSAIKVKTDGLKVRDDQWQKLQIKLLEGETVYRPSETKKRKRQSEPRRQRKRNMSLISESDSDDTCFSNDSNSNNEDSRTSSVTQEDRRPLTIDEIKQMLASFKNERKEVRESRKAIDLRIDAVKKTIANMQSERNRLSSEHKSVCIKGRNQYSRSAIKNDFALGIKE